MEKTSKQPRNAQQRAISREIVRMSVRKCKAQTQEERDLLAFEINCLKAQLAKADAKAKG